MSFAQRPANLLKTPAPSRACSQSKGRSQPSSGADSPAQPHIPALDNQHEPDWDTQQGVQPAAPLEPLNLLQTLCESGPATTGHSDSPAAQPLHSCPPDSPLQLVQALLHLQTAVISIWSAKMRMRAPGPSCLLSSTRVSSAPQPAIVCNQCMS